MLSLPDDSTAIWEAFAGKSKVTTPLTESAPQQAAGFSINISPSDLVDFLNQIAEDDQETRVFNQYHVQEFFENQQIVAELKKEWTKAAVHSFYDMFKEAVYHNPDFPTIYKPDQDEQEAIRGVEDGHRDNEDDQRRYARSQGIY